MLKGSTKSLGCSLKGVCLMLAKPLMFFSAYAPLFLILAIRFEDPTLRVACVALAVLGALALWLILFLNGKSEPGQHEVIAIRRSGAEASAFLAGYLLPFVTVASPSAADLLSYAIFFIIAGFVTVKTGVIQVNPLLFVFLWSIVEMEDANKRTFYMLTRKSVHTGNIVTATRLGNDVLVLKQVVQQ
jgi:hypothetical protein